MKFISGSAITGFIIIILLYQFNLTRQQQNKIRQMEDEKITLLDKLIYQQNIIDDLRQYEQINRMLTAKQLQQEKAAAQQHNVRQKEYHHAIKTNPCAAQPVPDSVIKLLRAAPAQRTAAAASS
jgi:hypothetical protein